MSKDNLLKNMPKFPPLGDKEKKRHVTEVGSGDEDLGNFTTTLSVTSVDYESDSAFQQSRTARLKAMKVGDHITDAIVVNARQLTNLAEFKSSLNKKWSPFVARAKKDSNRRYSIRCSVCVFDNGTIAAVAMITRESNE